MALGDNSAISYPNNVPPPTNASTFEIVQNAIITPFQTGIVRVRAAGYGTFLIANLVFEMDPPVALQFQGWYYSELKGGSSQWQMNGYYNGFYGQFKGNFTSGLQESASGNGYTKRFTATARFNTWPRYTATQALAAADPNYLANLERVPSIVGNYYTNVWDRRYDNT